MNTFVGLQCFIISKQCVLLFAKEEEYKENFEGLRLKMMVV